MSIRTFLSGAALLLLGCAHHEAKPAATAPATAARQTTAPGPQSASQTARSPGCNADADCGNRQLCVRHQCTDITREVSECGSARIHFDFNAVDIHPDDKPVLERMARCLKADHATHVTIEGNADERGTQEYNLALGDRRASAVARYLELLGVSQAQLSTVSYGKEQPLCTEHDESCWSKNRRAALTPRQARR